MYLGYGVNCLYITHFGESTGLSFIVGKVKDKGKQTHVKIYAIASYILGIGYTLSSLHSTYYIIRRTV